MKKCIVIYNPTSGKKNIRKQFSLLKQILVENNYEVVFRVTQYKNHAKKIIKNLDDDVDLVISLGGDGTFNEVVSGNFEREKKLLLSHIPLGTTNDIGAMFGYGHNIVNNLKLLISGEEKKIDICTINDRPFVYVAGYGKFLDIPYETSRKEKKRWGYLAYVKIALKMFVQPTKLFEVTYEACGETYRGLYSFIMISNANRIAGINKFYRDVKLNDNRFEVLFCNLTRRKDLLKSFMFMKATDIGKITGFSFHKIDKLKIVFAKKPRKHWCIDGEKLEKREKEYEIKIIRDIRILMPKKNIDSLFLK